MKTWNVGDVAAHSSDNRSYHIKTKSGQVISCNRVHLHETNVEFVHQATEHSKSFKSFEGVEKYGKELKALLVLMIIIELDLAMKSEKHLGIDKS